jgi:hypothetical protein
MNRHNTTPSRIEMKVNGAEVLDWQQTRVDLPDSLPCSLVLQVREKREYAQALRLADAMMPFPCAALCMWPHHHQKYRTQRSQRVWC